MLGHQTPLNKDHEHNLSIDKHNCNNKWAEAIKLEMDQQCDYDTYKDLGKTSPPKGRKKIRAHFAFDVKHDGRQQVRLVADGHLTYVTLSSVYS